MNDALFGLLSDHASSPAGGAVIALLKVTVVLLLALAMTLLMRRAAAGARHLVWLLALGAGLVVPAVALWSPLPVRVLPAVVRESVPTSAPATSEVRATAPLTSAANVTAAERTPTPPNVRRTLGVAAIIVIVWALGALALLARLAFGLLRVRRIVARARVLDRPDWQGPLYEVSDRLGLEDAPELLQSDEVGMPFATGFLKARIVLPTDSEGWTEARRSAVLIHELGHVRRRDLVGHTVGRLLCALYWFHPLMWTAARRLRAESERACDDLALMLGARPSEYAEHLLDIVTQVRASSTPAVALAMAKPSEFEGRMLAILDPRITRRGPSRRQTAALIGALTVLALVVGAVSPAHRVAANGPDPAGAATPLAAEAPSSQAPGPDVLAKAVDPETEPEPPAVERDRDARDQDPAPPDEDANDETPAKGDQRATILAKSLRSDSNHEVRRVAAWALSRYASADVAAEALADAVVEEDDEDVREMAAWALAEAQGSSTAVTALNTAFRRDKSAKVRLTAAWAAGSIGARSSVPGLTALLADSDPKVREVAAWSIGSCSPSAAPPALIHAISDPSPEVRLSVAWALREIGDSKAADALESAFRREQDPEVQRGLIRALGAMGEGAVETLSRLVESSDPEVRAVAVAALAGGNATGPWPWPRPEPRPFP
jgi:beta-lactamase regulating signal transducer with metallopeptidase domain/HEAT repeat protein